MVTPDLQLDGEEERSGEDMNVDMFMKTQYCLGEISLERL